MVQDPQYPSPMDFLSFSLGQLLPGTEAIVMLRMQTTITMLIIVMLTPCAPALHTSSQASQNRWLRFCRWAAALGDVSLPESRICRGQSWIPDPAGVAPEPALFPSLGYHHRHLFLHVFALYPLLFLVLLWHHQFLF